MCSLESLNIWTESSLEPKTGFFVAENYKYEHRKWNMMIFHVCIQEQDSPAPAWVASNTSPCFWILLCRDAAPCSCRIQRRLVTSTWLQRAFSRTRGARGCALSRRAPQTVGCAQNPAEECAPRSCWWRKPVYFNKWIISSVLWQHPRGGCLAHWWCARVMLLFSSSSFFFAPILSFETSAYAVHPISSNERASCGRLGFIQIRTEGIFSE